MCREMEIMRDKSRAEGKLEARRENAINLHNMGMDVDFIAKAVMVNVETVKQWIASALQ